MDFDRRRFILGLGALYTHGLYTESSEVDYLSKYYQMQIRKHGPPLFPLNFDKKTFQFKDKIIPIDRERFCYFNYDLDSSAERFLLVNRKATIELTSLASHGVNSGNSTAWTFSNAHGTLQSSLGLFVTGTHYVGRFGPSINQAAA